ncbi:MAG: PadR family transcriptional regulator [Bacteroidales bacterium]|nr:PadR family transcriptional regulator [Bacteroidales bacterium]
MNSIVLTEAVFYTLLVLHRPLHGYGIMQETKTLTNGRLNLSAGTLYGAISTMLEKGWIKPLPVEEDSRRKEYIITSKGKQVVQAEWRRLQELVTNGEKFLNL